MTTELHWLLLTLVMTALFWAPYIVDRIVVRGPWKAVSQRTPETGEPGSAWALRARCAHQNAVENLVLFTPAVLAAQVLHVSTSCTQMAAMVYFLARLVHFVAYVLGVPVVRTLAFATGWAATFAILASDLHWI